MPIRHRFLPLLVLGVLLAAQAASAAPPSAFTASYNVSQNGQPLGVARVTLDPADHGEWVFSKDVKGTSGLAAILGASLKESSRFRWNGDVPEAVSYDYELQTGIKNKSRRMKVDWATNQVSVDDDKGQFAYPVTTGMVERNTLSLALGMALRDGKQQVALPVAVRQRVESQAFKVTGKETIVVPAGRFHAERIDRIDAQRSFSAWYAPERYPIPVKLAQKDGGNMEMELVSFTAK